MPNLHLYRNTCKLRIFFLLHPDELALLRSCFVVNLQIAMIIEVFAIVSFTYMTFGEVVCKEQIHS
jgi:hypothetical protein